MTKCIYVVLFVTGFILLPLAQAATSEEETVETLALQPDEKKEISVPATEETKLGWEFAEGSKVYKQCKNNCINMIHTDGREMASMLGGSFKVKPADGKVALTFHNVEAFPMEIIVTKKAAN